MIAEPRDQYLARANTKREQVAALRAKGLSVRAIAEKLEISKSTTGRYTQKYERQQQVAYWFIRPCTTIHAGPFSVYFLAAFEIFPDA